MYEACKVDPGGPEKGQAAAYIHMYHPTYYGRLQSRCGSDVLFCFVFVLFSFSRTDFFVCVCIRICKCMLQMYVHAYIHMSGTDRGLHIIILSPCSERAAFTFLLICMYVHTEYVHT